MPYLRFIIIFLFFPALLFPSSHTAKMMFKNYQLLLKELSQELCSHGELEYYNRLYLEYRKSGEDIPLLLEDKIDRERVIWTLGELEIKKKWISRQVKYLEDHDWTSREEIEHLQDDLEGLIKIRHQYFLTGQSKYLLLSKKKIESLKENFKKFTQDAPYFLTYRFPVNYLMLRENYDKYKGQSQKESNRWLFERRLLEDGAPHQDFKSSDVRLRTVLSSVFFALQEEQELLSEDLRSDLLYIIRKVKKIHKAPTRSFKEDLLRWESAIEKLQRFYQNLLNDPDKVVLQKKLMSRKKLELFTKTKMRQLYSFLSKKNELYQSLFTVDAILLHEVGSKDSIGDSEKKDMLTLIYNRKHDPRFSQLSSEEVQRFGEKRTDSPWLNVLLKKGEFSFTYYFIPASVHLYCPSFSKRTELLRQRHVQLFWAFNHAPRQERSFKATHFFSRESMLGHIDMGKLWTSLVRLPPRVGSRLSSSLEKKYNHKWKNGYFLYYDRFESESKKIFTVVDFSKDPLGPNLFILSGKKPEFYYYRNPQQFRYFFQGTR